MQSMKRLTMRNHQREVSVDSPALRRQMRWLLNKAFKWTEYELAVHFVSAKRMALINHKHLGHEGPTDILTFDYEESFQSGEIFICPAVAAENAERHSEPLKVELARYLIHGLLHMNGHDDKVPAARQIMKREEDRLLHQLLRDG